MKTAKKFLALILAAACMMSLSIAAFATEADTTEGTAFTANIYIPKDENPFANLLIQLTGGQTAYLTNDSDYPISPASTNADYVINSDGKYVITIPVVSKHMAWISITDGTNTDAAANHSNSNAPSFTIVNEDNSSITASLKVTGVSYDSTYKENGSSIARISEITVIADSLSGTYLITGCTEHPCHTILGDKGEQNINLHLSLGE